MLADRTTTGSPAQWGEAAVKCHDDFDADDVVVEINFGGDMATEVVKQAAERVHQRGERESNMIRIKEVSASRGKWDRAVDGSPNRLDAAVWGLTRLSKVITYIPIA